MGCGFNVETFLLNRVTVSHQYRFKCVFMLSFDILFSLIDISMFMFRYVCEHIHYSISLLDDILFHLLCMIPTISLALYMYLFTDKRLC